MIVKSLLLPNKFKLIGWCLLIPATIMGVILSITNFEKFPLKTKVFAILNTEIFGSTDSFSIIQTNITPTVTGILFILGSLFVGFAKEESEDEFISELRLSSLLWAVWFNYSILLISFLFIYGTTFLTVMLYNMFTVLIIFIIRFNYILYKTSKSVPHEE